MNPARFTTFLVKVASRCNLDCDYCYVYHHADQSWRTMPKLLSEGIRTEFIRRVAEYAEEVGLERCMVIFHGGEPLLAKAQVLADFAKQLRANVGCQVDVSLQTNGLLLDDESLSIFDKANIGISLSIDGPQNINDKHRLTARGESSFNEVTAALVRLQSFPKIFAGVISVIDESSSPDDVLDFFANYTIPNLDFLLPDANHLRLPPGRNNSTETYTRWLIRAFDLWLDQYPHLSIRTFESLMDSLAGLPSSTDAFGFGDVSLLSIETDGSYHDLDVLKITHEGATRLFGTVENTSIAKIAESSLLAEHRKLLSKEGLCVKCKTCSNVEICGGGALPHRYSSDGFTNPTVYCDEMNSLIDHARNRLSRILMNDQRSASKDNSHGLDLTNFDLAEDAIEIISLVNSEANSSAVSAFKSALKSLDISGSDFRAIETSTEEELEHWAIQPGVICWARAIEEQRKGRNVCAVDGSMVKAESDYLSFLMKQSPPSHHCYYVGANDPWLRLPFGKEIYFENENVVKQALPVLDEAFEIIEQWRPQLSTEMQSICRAIQFVRDPGADPSKIVSFSDNSVPGALYVSVVQNDSLIDPYDLADSLIHEHRHQKLYLLERRSPVVKSTTMLVNSPWRVDPRPPSGLFHAVFVFVELLRFWKYVHASTDLGIKQRAENQINDSTKNLSEAFTTLESCPLTETGTILLKELRSAFKQQLQ